MIGGGINGVGVARDAAGRGMSVVLLEARDLACATSSASSKLIHGGLRYLEYKEFSMVREALMERERLLKQAPHLVRPMEFVLPHVPAQRPFWMIRLGLFLYDTMGGRKRLKKSRGVALKDTDAGALLRETYKRGFVYSDCWADDARLVVVTAMDAAERGAQIFTHTRCEGLEADADGWNVRVEGGQNFKAKAVVNAAGPWVRANLEESDLAAEGTPRMRLVTGSHIVVPKLYEGAQAYTMQQPDGRIVFTIPYEGNYTVIGTTEEPLEGSAYDANISDAEISYLIDAVERYFDVTVSPDSIHWTYSGVRPLYDDGSENASATTRDYRLHQTGDDAHPLLSIFGGKLTTYRAVAEDVVNRLGELQGRHLEPWTASSALPGGDIESVDELVSQHIELPANVALRLARAYGSRMERVVSDLGKEIVPGFYEGELRYLIEQEWARELEDVLWRRSKLGLVLTKDEQAAVAAALQEMLS